MRNAIGVFLLMANVCFLASCSVSKFVPKGAEMLSSVRLVSTDKSIDPTSYRGYVRQESNARWFNLIKVPLGIYSLSGRDSTKGFNRFLQRTGEAPVLYDSRLMTNTITGLTLAMQSKGYLNANTTVDVRRHRNRIKLTYIMRPGTLYRIQTLDFNIDDALIDSLLKMHRNESLLSVGMPCDAGILDSERDRIISLLHRNGYYHVLKNFITYDLDSINGPKRIALTLHFQGKATSEDTTHIYTQYKIRRVTIDVNKDNAPLENVDSINYRGMNIRYYGKRQIRPNVIYSQIRMMPDRMYDDDNIQATYRNLSALQAIRYVSVKTQEVDSNSLDCHIIIQANKVNTLSAELEGTNTSGDLGMATSVSFVNRNLFRGSEVWTTKLKGAFEAITGLEGYNDQNYFEISAESRLNFPRIIVPFLPERKRLKLNGSSELSLQYNSQNRPEFHRRVLTGAWSYRWNNNHNRIQQKLDLASVNYVFMPWISNTFRHDYLDSVSSRSAIIRYSYENLFIVNSAYSFVYNSSGSSANGSINQKNAYQIHFNVESAGNFLYLLSSLFNAKKDKSNYYTLFNIAFAQYAKFDFDYARSFLIDNRNSLALRCAFGLSQPFGNSSIVPFEKSYFAGGANSVRGWSVRQLGPGSYSGKDGAVDFINQTGNLKLLFSMELRSYLFWKLHGAFFADAGNIWTTRDYDAQPGGQFRIDKFYKQIAMSYGIGFRLNFDYFILRFDMAMKAINPAYESGDLHYPIIHPNFHRDFTFHFAVGLPF